MDADFSRLTEREKRICKMVQEDLTTEEIAKRLGLSQQTVRHNLSEIYEKVGVKTKLELVQALDKGAG
jgi:RNA polymerase sigma factor (sigma-70 family)